MALIENIGFISITFVSFLLFTFFVASLLSRGWTLVGGIQVSAQGTATYHYQAMAK